MSSTNESGAVAPPVGLQAKSGVMEAIIKKLLRPAEMIGYFVVMILLWEGIIRALDVQPFVFPAPSDVVVSFYQGIASGTYLYHLSVTLVEVIAGFAMGSFIGILLGVGMVTVPFMERVLYPYVVAIQTIPKVAIAPLMIVWFGFGIQSKCILVAMMCMFPVLVNTIAGLRATDSDRLALVKAMSGTRYQVLRYVQLPTALPYIFAGLNTAIVFAVIGAITGEFVGAVAGVGVLILQANFGLDLPQVFALLFLLSIIGIILNSIMRLLEKRICFWSGRAAK